ncbi:YjbH domain-containing protein [Escherichia coli]
MNVATPLCLASRCAPTLTICSAPSYNDNARPQYQPQPQDAILQHSVVANQLTLLKYNAGLADPQIQAKGDTLYVTGEQVKYRDSREGIIRAKSDRD